MAERRREGDVTSEIAVTMSRSVSSVGEVIQWAAVKVPYTNASHIFSERVSNIYHFDRNLSKISKIEKLAALITWLSSRKLCESWNTITQNYGWTLQQLYFSHSKIFNDIISRLLHREVGHFPRTHAHVNV